MSTPRWAYVRSKNLESSSRSNLVAAASLLLVTACGGAESSPSGPSPTTTLGNPAAPSSAGTDTTPAADPSDGVTDPNSGQPSTGGPSTAPAGSADPTDPSNLPDTPLDDASCDEASAPRAPLRRITRFEYNNSIRDLLGVSSNPADALPGEEAGSGFGNDADALGVSRLLIDGYRSVAQQVALEVTADEAAVLRTTGCSSLADQAACQSEFLPRYLTRIFRRPPTSEELTDYGQTLALGQELRGDFASGVQAVVERSLQAPQFLYRVEVGVPDAAAPDTSRLTGYEMATRLSYLLWSSAPDEALLSAAADGTLETPEGVLSEARRLLADERSKDSLRYFHGHLLGISGLDYVERNQELYPAFKPGMGALFRKETETFLEHVIFDGEGDLSTVFMAPYTFVNQDLAEFYGIQGVTGDDFVQVTLDPSQRAGLLTQASILTVTTPGSRTDPVVRGKWLYTKMLCGVVPDPPMNVPLLPEPEPGQSVRERLAQHRADPACAGCHTLMDPLGLAFEHYDGVGAWRDTDNGAEIDVSGEIPTTDVAGPFEGAIEFAQRVAQSQDARECYVGRYLTYAYGRALDAEDACSQGRAESAFEQAGGNIQELVLAVTQTDAFLTRAKITPGQ